MSKTVPAVILITMATGCASRERPVRAETQATAGAPAVAVHTVVVARQSWPDSYEATGTVQARTVTALASKVMAYVRTVNVQVGDRVREGQLLAEMDTRDLDANLRAAQAAREEAKNAAAEADNAAAGAQAALELSRATHRRMKELFDKASISNQEMDEAQARLRQAEANHQIALSRRRQLAAKIAQSEEAVRSAEIALSYTRIAAPFAGVLTTKNVEPGNLAVPGAPLLTVERAGAYRLEVPIDESRLQQVRNGQRVTVHLDALDRTIESRVVEIVPAVDPASRSFTAKIDLPAGPQLHSGLSGRAVFVLGQVETLAIPADAARERGQLQTVLTADHGKAQTRVVTLGRTLDNRREALSGLSGGEQIIYPVPAGLHDGATLQVLP